MFSIFFGFCEPLDGQLQQQQQMALRHFRKQHPRIQLLMKPIIPTITSNGIWRVLQVKGNPFLSTPITDSMGQWCSKFGCGWGDTSTIRFVLVAFLVALFSDSKTSEWRFPTEILGNLGMSPKSFIGQRDQTFHCFNMRFFISDLNLLQIHWCRIYLALHCVHHFSNPYLASPYKTLLEMAQF